MKRWLFIWLLSSSAFAQTVRSGNARFTVLTPGLIRMEYDSTRQFKDATTFVVINRKLPPVPFTQRDSAGWLIIKTSKIILRYNGKFDREHLSINNWHPGDKQLENLKGTYRTLDRMDGDSDLYFKKKLQLEDGLLAKDGWTLLDDSKSLTFRDGWVAPAGTETDWYFFAYGHDYKTALLDYTRIAGKVPLPPRYAFGYWWSRYWAYSDNELHDLIGHFHEYNIPLDVLVIDMDWHKELSEDQWTGWTFNDAYFTNAPAFLKYAHQNNLKVTLNLHPAFGIAPDEDALKTDHIIPYEGSNRHFMDTLFNQVLRPLEKDGVDFWWLDWQQWPKDKKIAQLDNVWWLNYTFFTDKAHSSTKRPLIYHRWGGLGNHRYETGFSGDTYISWKSLAYQPYFTNTASNVLYGYWSHDIGGHMSLPGEVGIDPELYTRWVQCGAFSPVFRTHSSKNPTLNKELWNFKAPYFDALLGAIKRRYALAPYIYGMARQCYDTGIALCRPLYYDYDLPESYTHGTEYLFGDALLVAPIGAPGGEVKFWLPPGDWYDWSTGALLHGDQDRTYAIDEYPVFVRSGAMIPMYDSVSNLQAQQKKVVIAVFPGNGGGTFYEDNGDDQQYDQQYAVTKMTSTSEGVVIGPRTGSFAGMIEHDYELKLYATKPTGVTVNGKPVVCHYDGAELAMIIDLPKAKSYHIQVQRKPVTGLIERMKRLRAAIVALKYRNADLVITPEIGLMEELNRELEYAPQRFDELTKTFDANWQQLPTLVKKLQLTPNDEQWFLQQLGLGAKK